jgi:Mg-chelatase subunit ChlD
MEYLNGKNGILKTSLLLAVLFLSFLSWGGLTTVIKIDALREAANGSVLTATERGYKVGLVGFSSPSSCASGICSWSALTHDANSLQTQISTYEALEGTCISCGLNKARQILANATGEKHIVLMSDGIPNYCIGGVFCYEDSAKADARSEVASAAAAGMSVDVIGLGNTVDMPFLQNLSSTGGGKYYNVTCACPLECVYTRIIDDSRDNVVLVSDLSGSMADVYTLNCTTTTSTTSPTTTMTKMQETRGALHSSVDLSLARSNPVGLVAFSSPPSCVQGICSSSAVTSDPSALHAQIDTYQPLDGTCISCGINRGLQLLSGVGDPKYMILLSDGVPQYCISGAFCDEASAKAEALAQAASAKAAGIKIHSVAVGSLADKPFMQNISNTAGGRYYEPTCDCSLECVYENIVNTEDGTPLMVNDVSGSMADSSWINCSATTTTSTSTTSSTTSTTSSTTTTQGSCITPGDYPPCDEITLGEVVSAINQWASGTMTLGSIVYLINAWAAG